MKEILKYSIWAGLFAVLLVPFIIADSMFFPFITGKAFTFRIIVEIITGLWLILILIDKEFRPKFSWVLASVFTLLLVLFLADINAVAKFKAFWSNYERMEGFVAFAHFSAYFLVLASMLNKEKMWLWFLRVNVIVGTIMAIIGLFEGVKENIIRIAGPLGNPIYFAVYFLFIFFFTLILLYKDVLAKRIIDWEEFKGVFSSILFYLYLPISFLSLYMTYRSSRGALLGAIGGIFVSAVLIAIFEKERKVIKQIALGGIVAVIVIVGSFLSMRESSFVKNNPTLSRLAEISWNNTNGQARQLIWPMALKGFQEKPILGWGQEGFNYVFNKYYDPAMYGQETWFDRAHNAPLDFLIAGGILGLLAYLALFISSLFMFWFRPSFLSVTERALLTGLLAGYFFQGIFVFDNNIGYILFFMTLAYIHSRSVDQENRNISKKKEEGFWDNFLGNQEYQNYIFIPAIAIFTVALIWVVNVPAIKANKALINTFGAIQAENFSLGLNLFKKALSYRTMGDSEIREQLIFATLNVLRSVRASQNIKSEFLNLNLSELDKQIALVPNDARYYILKANFLSNIGQYEQALASVYKAIELSPKKQAMRFELVSILYHMGRLDEAVVEAEKAYELDKNYEQAKSLYEALNNENMAKKALRL